MAAKVSQGHQRRSHSVDIACSTFCYCRSVENCSHFFVTANDLSWKTLNFEYDNTNSHDREIVWTNKVRYLGVHLVSSKALSCNFDLSLIKKSSYRAFNAIYGKVGRLALVDVVIELLRPN